MEEIFAAVFEEMLSAFLLNKKIPKLLRLMAIGVIYALLAALLIILIVETSAKLFCIVTLMAVTGFFALAFRKMRDIE